METDCSTVYINYIKNKYKKLCSNCEGTCGDIFQHLPTLYKYASECESVFETGVRGVVSSWAFSYGLLNNGQEKKQLFMNDVSECNISELLEKTKHTNLKIDYKWINNLELEVTQNYDITFIDTWHIYGQLKRELNKFSKFTNKYIIMHDTTVDEIYGETVRRNWNAQQQAIESGFPVEEIRCGLWKAIEEFLVNNSEWKIKERYTNNNGLTILEKVNKNTALYTSDIINITNIYKNKIVDCFIFYNELELLKYRLNILYEVVDYFVIVESTHTFIGKEKQLIFNENKHLFEKFSDKIIHIIVSDFPHKYPNINLNFEQWNNEKYQRNCIHLGIEKLKLQNTDLIIISDLDEIPNPNTLLKIKNNEINVDINILEMDLYYYNLNSKIVEKWLLVKILSYNKYKSLSLNCEQIRSSYNCKIIKDGGWHLSYFGDSNFIKNKIQMCSHQEYNNDNFTNVQNIDNHINKSTDLYNRNIEIKKISINDNKNLPYKYDEYLKQFILF